MNDCSNGEMRDLLPDLLHERLDGERRVAVLEHVSGCVDCRTELTLLRDLRGALAMTPAVDVDRIVCALPAPPARVTRPARRVHSWVDWRVAAAVTLVAVGGTSLATLVRTDVQPVAVESVGQTAAVTAASAPMASAAARSVAAPTQRVASSTAPAEPRPVPGARGAGRASNVESARGELSMSAAVGDLTDQELRALLSDIGRLDAVPSTEPEPVVVSTSALPSRGSAR